VFKRKQEAKNAIRYKARLVIRGFMDKNKYDLSETYAPVARLTDVRFLLAVANKFKLQIHQLDIKTAFLNGELEKKVFMEIPDGYEGKEELNEKYVCELSKALYGLKVSPKLWYEKLRITIEKCQFSTYEYQPCIFMWRKEGKFVIMLIYVDDILIVGNSSSKINQTKDILNKEFEISNLGSPEKFLGIEISHDVENSRLMLSQREFILKMLKKFKMEECNPVQTPMVTAESEKKTTKNENIKIDENIIFPYRQAVGSLLYLANATRPDITYAVNLLSRKQSNFDLHDWLKVKRIFRYLKGTINLSLVYEGKGDNLECYVDASLGVNEETGKSTNGVLIKLFGDIIHWKTKKQSHVALSTAEAEYIAMSMAVKEIKSLNKMCDKLIKLQLTPIVYEDNTAAIKIAKSDESQTLKHIVKLCYHFIRMEVANKNIIIKWINSDNQIADAFTKVLGPKAFDRYRNMMLK
ncbi:MAG: hypothetical protein H9Q66_04970, partial [Spiroplasma ixodetis]|nr:hypothetical protein [Spiroplasma ixodetis]